MDQASPQCMDDDSNEAAHLHQERLPRMVVHFAVAPGATLTWRVEADSTLTVQRATLWLTRISSPYDHWLQPGQTCQLQRGERIWLSTDATNATNATDGVRAAHVTLSYAWHNKQLTGVRGFMQRWLGRLASLGLGPPAPR